MHLRAFFFLKNTTLAKGKGIYERTRAKTTKIDDRLIQPRIN